MAPILTGLLTLTLLQAPATPPEQPASEKEGKILNGGTIIRGQEPGENDRPRSRKSAKPSASRATLEEVLKSTVTIEFNGTVKELLEVFRVWKHLTIVTDESVAERNLKQSIKMSLEKTPIRTVLENGLGQAGLICDQSEGKVVISSEEPIVISGYAVEDLLATYEIDAKNWKITAKLDDNRIREVMNDIREQTGKDNWKANGGVGTMEHHTGTSMLVVKHHQWMQDAVAKVLDGWHSKQEQTKEQLRANMAIFAYYLGSHKDMERLAKKGKDIEVVTVKVPELGPTKGGSEESAVEPVKGTKPAWCWDMDVDEKTGQARFRLLFQFGMLNVHAERGRDGRGFLKIGLGIHAMNKTLEEN